MARITVFGTGYVGSVSAAVLADKGNDVIGVDNDPQKIAVLKQGKSHIYEPGLEALLSAGVQRGNLQFTTDVKHAVRSSDYIMIAVGTPSVERVDPKDPYLCHANLAYVFKVGEEIADVLDTSKIIIQKSTVPVGTSAQLETYIRQRSGRNDVHVVSSPEFLRQGLAVLDTQKPDRLLIGTDEEHVGRVVRSIFSDVPEELVVYMRRESAEHTKLANNTFLALSISFINEQAQFADAVGSDITEVATGMRLDARIGKKAFLAAGHGYGGSCFGKDVKSNHTGMREHGLDGQLPRATLEANDRQVEYVVRKVTDLVPNLHEKTIALLGLAFKNNTDDVRDSRSIDLACRLAPYVGRIKGFDHHALETSRRALALRSAADKFPYLEKISFGSTIQDTVAGSDVLYLGSEDETFGAITPATYARLMRQEDPAKKIWLFEGRHTYRDLDAVRKAGFHVYSIGRPEKRT